MSESKWEQTLVQQVSQLERELVIRALIDGRGNVARAGRICGHRPSTMWMKVKKLGIDPKAYRVR